MVELLRHGLQTLQPIDAGLLTAAGAPGVNHALHCATVAVSSDGAQHLATLLRHVLVQMGQDVDDARRRARVGVYYSNVGLH